MVVVTIATLLSFLALVTGIAAVGSGAKWQFEPKDIIKGRRNALLYIWVTLSTIFSLAHFVANFNYLLSPDWGFGPAIQMWFWLHAVVGLLFIGAHAFIHLTLSQENLLDSYFWGDG